MMQSDDAYGIPSPGALRVEEGEKRAVQTCSNAEYKTAERIAYWYRELPSLMHHAIHAGSVTSRGGALFIGDHLQLSRSADEMRVLNEVLAQYGWRASLSWKEEPCGKIG